MRSCREVKTPPDSFFFYRFFITFRETFLGVLFLTGKITW